MQEAADSPRRWCFGCGDANPEGLRIQFTVDGRRVTGEVEARQVAQGYPGPGPGRHPARWWEAAGQLRIAGGPLIAEAKAMFMRLPADKAREMQAFYLAGSI